MIAEGFIANGARVYLCSRDAETGRATAMSLAQKYHGTCQYLQGSVSDLAGIRNLAEQFRSLESRLDVLINNAGVSVSSEIDDFSESDWDKVIDTNLKGCFFLTQNLLPELRIAADAEDPARVINIGSVDGLKNPRWENYSYGASKAALHHMTRQLSVRLVKEHIIVNAIAPGPFPTTMLAKGAGLGTGVEEVDWSRPNNNNPRGRIGTAEDIAGLSIYLASRAGAFTVGATITCDGGAVARS